MSEQNEGARNIAAALVERYAPNELPLFDTIWSDAERHSPEILLGDLPHGSGAEMHVTLVTSVLIPIAVAVCSHAVIKSFEALVKYLRERRDPLPPSISTEELARTLTELLNRDRAANSSASN